MQLPAIPGGSPIISDQKRSLFFIFGPPRTKKNSFKYPDKHRNTKDLRIADRAICVRTMFAAIATHYDRLNRLLSLNLDRSWRRRAAQIAHLQPRDRAADLCCGTGDLAFALTKAQPDLEIVVGVDFAQPMLRLAAAKAAQVGRSARCRRKGTEGRNVLEDARKPVKTDWLCADAGQLPFGDEQFDCVGCAFGVRNLADIGEGLREMARVLRPSGRAVILEFFLPATPWFRWLYECYFRLVLPTVGGIMVSGRGGAYRYLPESVRMFGTPAEFLKQLQEAGLTTVRVERLLGGAVLAFVARKVVDGRAEEQSTGRVVS